MSATVRVGGFVLVLTAIAGVAMGVGAAVGPVQAGPEGHGAEHRDSATRGDPMPGGQHDGHESTTSPGAATGTSMPGGLAVAWGGYSLELLRDRFDRPGDKELRFQVQDSAGMAVTSYRESHGKDLHLIVVRRDLTDFQHVHPVLGDDGTWSVPVTLSSAGQYRVFADFRAEGAASGCTLGHDLSVGGDYRPRSLPTSNRTARIDGYAVHLGGDLVAGETSRLTLTVTRAGVPVTDLQPHLGAYGHLVALRDDDLAYLHVHPEGAPGDGHTSPGPEITFDTEVPSRGDYRLFLDFRREGRVHTVAFTLPAAGVDDARPTLAAGPAERPHSH